MDITEKVRKLINNDIIEAGYILDQVIYEKEGSIWFLRIVITKEGIIDIEDCIKVNNIINPILDKEDPIPNSYILDVCSKEKGSDIKWTTKSF